MWKRRWSRTPPPEAGTRVDANTTGQHPSVPLFARKGAYPPGYRREPSSDGAAWISGARLFFSSSLPGRLSLCDRWRGWLAACVAPAPGTGACRPPQSRCGPPSSGLHWLNHARGWPPPRAGVTEARGPLCPRHRWSLWIVGRWPVLIPRFPGGAAPREPPFVGVSAGPDPPPEARMPQATQRPQGRTGGTPCVRTGV